MFILAAMPHSVAVTLVPPLAEMPFDALLDSARIQAGPPPESEAIERAEMFMDAVLVKTRASRSASGVVTVTCTAWLPSPVGEAISAAATCEARMPCAAATLGRASGRGRVGQYVSISVGAGTLK